MPKRLILITSCILFSATAAHAQYPDPILGDFSFDGDVIALPLNTDTGHPKVAVDLGDGNQHQFIVDTGASLNVIDERIAEERGYEIVGETEIGAPGGPQIPGKIVRVPHVQLANGVLTDAEFVTMDVDGFSRGTTQGVLGYAVFRNHLLTFDLGVNEIRVSNGSLSAGDTGVVPYDDTNSHVEISIDVAGTPVPTHIDTGSMGGFMLPGELAETLPLKEAPKAGISARLVGGQRDIKHGDLVGAVEFAGRSYDNPNIAFMTPSTGYGNIGSQIYGEVELVIDQKNKLVQFRDPEPGQRAAVSKPRRVGVQFRGMGGGPLTVGGVMPGSLAEKAGLVAGDVLVSINDKATEDYAMSELGALFRSLETLQINIDRNGESHNIEIE